MGLQIFLGIDFYFPGQVLVSGLWGGGLEVGWGFGGGASG